MILLWTASFGKKLLSVNLTVHAVAFTLVALWCIMGLNKCTQECPLISYTTIKLFSPKKCALYRGIRGDYLDKLAQISNHWLDQLT